MHRGLRKLSSLLWLPLQAAMILATPSLAVRADVDASSSLPIRVERDVVYHRAAGVELLADVYRPDDDRPRPGVLMIHGGAWTAGNKRNYQDHARQLAQAGYVAVPVNYRLAPKFTYPAQLEDARAALAWMFQSADRWHIDKRYLAVYGYSAGAQLAAILATNPLPDSPRLSAAVCGGAPCDFSFLPKNNRTLAHVMGGTPEEKPEVYRDASAVNFASGDDCPTFFFHGTTDLLVPSRSSQRLRDALKSQGVDTEYFKVEGQGHVITFIHPSARQAAIDFLGKYLKLDR